MKYHNPELHAATKSYVIAAIDLIRKRVPNHLTDPEIADQTFFFAKLHANDELQTLTEYNQCLRVLTADATFASQLGVLAGPRGGPRSLNTDAKGLIWQFPDLGLPSGQTAFDDAYFEKEYAELEKAYYATEIEYYAVAPLNGFIAGGPITLSENIEITELQKDDFSISVKEKGSTAQSYWFEKLYAVRVRYSLPKAIGEDHALTPQLRQNDDSIQIAANQLIEEVVTALRLCGVESVYVPGVLHKTSKWSFGQSRPFPGQFQPDIRFSMTVDFDWLQRFSEFWATLQTDAVKRRGFLVTATRRFGYAHERYRTEDKIIDLLISAEALLLSDSSYTGEVKHRLSQRTALFLTERSDDRRIVFDRMGIAYDMRSKVAHGGTYKKQLPNKADGTAFTLEEFVWQIHEYVRSALLKAVKLALLPETPYELVKWDELLFPEPEPKSSE
ncbi:MAG TPA: hypothetical protein VJV03_08530 [Pyrinomonadaceae bacterium]|nr:hypothetical protein [Pyrinomonadaceae bacterium]